MEEFGAAQNSHREALTPYLLRIARASMGNVQLLPSDLQQIVQDALLISKTLGKRIFKDVTTYKDVPTFSGPLQDYQTCQTECKLSFNGYALLPASSSPLLTLLGYFSFDLQLQQIRDLQMKLNSTNDHAEMWALEEDVTGRVLHLIGEFIERGLAVLVNDDDKAHLQQIITDAEKGMLKWELLCSAWAQGTCRTMFAGYAGTPSGGLAQIWKIGSQACSNVIRWDIQLGEYSTIWQAFHKVRWILHVEDVWQLWPPSLNVMKQSIISGCGHFGPRFVKWHQEEMERRLAASNP
ncbi:hypothetical protein EDC04DRAFT_2601073 [Pisolithus marmoratus]|nr:hypothetical protein EDC04DRAFT_2601073 [Pisolithus marmoratus]